MRIMICMAVCIAVFLPSTVFSAEFEHDVYGLLQFFEWREFDNGDELLKEDGVLVGAGYAGRYILRGLFVIRPRIEFFGGEVDYDGQACTLQGSCIPSETDTKYIGTRIEDDIGLRFHANKSAALEPFLGLGGRFWRREIQGSAVARGSTENWGIVYGRLGLRGDVTVADRVALFLEGTVKLAIDNREEAEDVCSPTGCRDIDLEPGRRPSYYAELGIRIFHFKISGFYENLRFAESDVEPIGGGFGIFQPESEADIFGINAMFTF